ncbi:hypothetical protein [Viridibacillus arvi]|uniref:hypothetical protein n=1 Tax=Viridibacillus arvi TaxID=263475 RepID=UPI003CFF2578
MTNEDAAVLLKAYENGQWILPNDLKTALKSAVNVLLVQDKLLSIARFYAHPQTYAWIDDKSRYIPSDIEDDKGNKARKVLEELGYESY